MLFRFFSAATFAAVLWFYEAPGAAGQISPDTLRFDVLLEEALRAHPALREARLSENALRQRPDQLSALPDPMFTLTALPVPLVTARGEQRSQIRIEQRVPFPGKRSLRSRVASLEADVAGATTAEMALEITADVKWNYDELFRIQEQTRLVGMFMENLREFEEAAIIQYENGRGSQQAILKAQLERYSLEVRLLKLEEQRVQAASMLAELLDRADVQAFDRPVARRKVEMFQREANLLDQAMEDRPRAESLRSLQEQADRRILLARKESYPDFTFGIHYFDIVPANMSPNMNGRDALALSVAVNVPLWRGKLRAAREEAALQDERVGAQVAVFENELRAGIQNVTEVTLRQEDRLRLLEDSLIPLAETTRSTTLIAYSNGRAQFLDLLDIERTLLNLHLERIDTQTAMLHSSTQLERLTGANPANNLP